MVLIVLQWLRFLETVLIGTIGGIVFAFLHFPLPFILGSLTFVTLWQGLTRRICYIPDPIVDTGFTILGINFGLAFTLDTFRIVSMYIVPFLCFTFFLIFVTILSGLFLAKKIAIDPVTSVFACIPGGLTEMTLASKDLGGNEAYVAIFQTIRLVTVIFIIPFVLTRFFPVVEQDPVVSGEDTGASFTLFYFLYLIPACAGFLLKKRLPAGMIIGALGLTALLNLTSLPLPAIPPYITAGAQILFGVSLGRSITFRELRKAGKYGFYYFGASLMIIVFSFICGGLLTRFTTLNWQTALLSTAPGGLFEMVVTSTAVNGDPAIVSSLQLIRIFIIVTAVPASLKWFFKKYQLFETEKEKR